MARCGSCGGNQQQCTCVFVGCIENTFQAQAIDLPGTSGNYVSTPDSVKTSITGDIDIRVKVALDDWSPASGQNLVAKWGNSGAASQSFILRIPTGIGRPQFFAQPNLSGGVLSSAATGFTDGTTHWVRVTLDVDNGAGGNDVKFYTSDDGVTWSQLGTTQTTAGTTSITDSTTEVRIGTQVDGTNLLAGNVYYAEVRNGINGDIVAVFDPTRVIVAGPQMPATVDSPEGETWTVNGSGWAWISQSSTAPTCATVTGNGQTWAPINYRPNNVPLPRPYGQLYRLNSVQTIAFGATVPVVFDSDTEYLYAGGMANVTAQPTRLTATQDGYYLVHGVVNPDRDIQLFIRKNGDIAQTVAARGSEGASVSSELTSIVTLIRMLTGEYVELMVFNNNQFSAAVDLELFGLGGNDSSPQFWAQWERSL